jgi:hypothetical protein
MRRETMCKMLFLGLAAILALATMGAIPARAQAGPTLLVTVDLDCDWKLDGVAQGRLTADDAKIVKLSTGQHLVQAKSTDGKDTWKTIVTLDQDGQKILQITLKDTLQQQSDQNNVRSQA